MQNEIAFISNLITDIKGARDMLAARAGIKEYNRQTIHYHVQKGNLPAYIFVGMDLVRWDRNNPNHHQGKEYLFLKQDIREMPLNNKVGRKPKDMPHSIVRDASK
jgi:hypothetical protein